MEFFLDLEICRVAPRSSTYGGGGHMWEGGICRGGVYVK